MEQRKHIVIVGGGPAGLRAAEVCSADESVRVSLFDQKRSVGRKFLVAGKGGLNITHSEPLDTFETRYSGPGQPSDFWKRTLTGFDNRATRAWTARLDVATFVASSGRVYPKALKAAPLLRRWVKRLKDQGVEFHLNHQFTTLETHKTLRFNTPDGEKTVQADAIIFALGGASWPQTGSDGQWSETFAQKNIELTPFKGANCGWEVSWPDELREKIEAQPLKNIHVSAAGETAIGELMPTAYGLEGGPIYTLGPALRNSSSPTLSIDFKPTFTAAQLERKVESVRRNWSTEVQRRWKLSAPAVALIQHFAKPSDNAQSWATAAKNCPVPLLRPRPVEEAISTAGGVKWSELSSDLELKDHSGVFLAGEMIDWEAPTGGYLMQGCFATGTLAAKSALSHLSTHH